MEILSGKQTEGVEAEIAGVFGGPGKTEHGQLPRGEETVCK